MGGGGLSIRATCSFTHLKRHDVRPPGRYPPPRNVRIFPQLLVLTDQDVKRGAAAMQRGEAAGSRKGHLCVPLPPTPSLPPSVAHASFLETLGTRSLNSGHADASAPGHWLPGPPAQQHLWSGQTLSLEPWAQTACVHSLWEWRCRLPVCVCVSPFQSVFPPRSPAPLRAAGITGPRYRRKSRVTKK